MSQIEINNLTKGYGKLKVLDHLTLTLTKDVINFIVGPNGSGKSTLIKCIMQLIKYQGKIKGNDVSIAYMPEQLPLPDFVRVDTFLNLIGRVKGMENHEVRSILRYFYEKFNIIEHIDKYLIHLSKGTKQKVMLIQTLLAEVDIYVFDEPINGLDIDAQKVFFEELKELRKKQKMIIITTHHLKNYRFKNKRVIHLNEYFDLESIDNESFEASSTISI